MAAAPGRAPPSEARHPCGPKSVLDLIGRPHRLAAIPRRVSKLRHDVDHLVELSGCRFEPVACGRACATAEALRGRRRRLGRSRGGTLRAPEPDEEESRSDVGAKRPIATTRAQRRMTPRLAIYAGSGDRARDAALALSCPRRTRHSSSNGELPIRAVGLFHSASANTLSSSRPRTQLWSRPLLPAGRSASNPGVVDETRDVVFRASGDHDVTDANRIADREEEQAQVGTPRAANHAAHRSGPTLNSRSNIPEDSTMRPCPGLRAHGDADAGSRRHGPGVRGSRTGSRLLSRRGEID
jgi:hypothetical protein